jgi:hypothetical protein
VLAVGSLVLTWYLWHRSGPKLKVTAFVRAETGTVHIDVSNSGRLTATVRQILLRDHLSIPTSGTGTTAISRWALQVEPASGDPLPREVAPSAYLEADVDVKTVLTKADGMSTVMVMAWAQRGDNKWVRSKPLRVR